MNDSTLKKCANLIKVQPQSFTKQQTRIDDDSTKLLPKISKKVQISKDSSSKRSQCSTIQRSDQKKSKPNDRDDNLADGLIYGILWPLILDKNKKPYCQPFLIKFKEKDLIDSGFALPFEAYKDNEKNFFRINIHDEDLICQLIATGYTIPSIRSDLIKNVKENDRWTYSRKILRYFEKILYLKYEPLISPDDAPDIRILSPKTLSKIFGHTDTNYNVNQTESVPESKSNKEKEQSAEKKTRKKFHSKEIDLNQVEQNEYDNEQSDYTKKEMLMKDLTDLNDQLKNRRFLLSENDTTGSTILLMMKTLQKITQIIKEDDKNETEIANIVSTEDETFKMVSRNAIFIDGLIQLELDQYEIALRKATIGDPSSFAYQVIRFCFPESYYLGVSLGKRTMTKPDIEKILKSRESDSKIKYPLQYVWGFKDPFLERMQGIFNYSLGQKRVHAFINHLFRESGIMLFSEKAHFKVRSRIVKVLCARNHEYLKSKMNIQDHTDSDEKDDPISKDCEDPDDNFLDLDEEEDKNFDTSSLDSNFDLVSIYDDY